MKLSTLLVRTPFVILLGLLLSAAGCFGGSGPEVGEVSGTVTLNGEPVKEVQVFFEPVEGGRSSFAMTDEQGHYELSYSGETKGALVGEHLVRLTTARGTKRDDSGNVTVQGMKELFPPEYNTNSTQRVTVEGGDNVIDFNVTTP